MIREVVDELHDHYNISIEVAFAQGDSLIRIYNREATETFTYLLPSSSTNSFHTTALGKAFLSTLTPDQIFQKIQTMELAARTEKTITDHEILLNDLLTCKQRGYAMTVEEYIPGLVAIAAPLFDPVTGAGVGAVSFDFSIMQHKPEEIAERYADIVIQTRSQLATFVSTQITLEH